MPLTSTEPANSSDYLSEIDLQNVTKEVMAKLQGNYTRLKPYLNIPDYVMAEIDHKYKDELYNKIFHMLKWWIHNYEYPTKKNLVKCLVETDRTLWTVENILKLGAQGILSPPTKKTALCGAKNDPR